MIKNPTYRIYEAPNKIVAVSSFAGQFIRGVAKCNPADEFDPEKGTALAIARCDTKIAEKRMKRACSKVDEAKAQLDAAMEHYSKMLKYEADAEANLNRAYFELENVVCWICNKGENQ